MGKRNGRWIHNGKELPSYVSFFQVWPKGAGKYWKRRLARKRRRAWKDPHERGLSELESIVNWRDW